MKRFLQGVLLPRWLLSGTFKVLTVNKNDTDNWTLPTNEKAIWVWVPCVTLQAVNEKERKTKGWQYFQGICPQMTQFCFLWTLKVGLQVSCEGGIKPEESQNVWCCHTGRKAFGEDHSPLVAKRTGVLSPGAILNKSPVGVTEQEMNYCSLDNKIHHANTSCLAKDVDCKASITTANTFWVENNNKTIPECWERSEFQVWGCW